MSSLVQTMTYIILPMSLTYGTLVISYISSSVFGDKSQESSNWAPIGVSVAFATSILNLFSTLSI